MIQNSKTAIEIKNTSINIIAGPPDSYLLSFLFFAFRRIFPGVPVPILRIPADTVPEVRSEPFRKTKITRHTSYVNGYFSVFS